MLCFTELSTLSPRSDYPCTYYVVINICIINEEMLQRQKDRETEINLRNDHEYGTYNPKY